MKEEENLIPRKRTRTSSFGTSKREGHDATPFYSSNLYRGLTLDTTHPVIDRSAAVDMRLFPDGQPYSDPLLASIPDSSVHLVLVDCAEISGSYLQNYSLTPSFEALLQECLRILVTGGRLGILLDDHLPGSSGGDFIPNHATVALKLIQLGVLLRGEIIWKHAGDQGSVLPLPSPLGAHLSRSFLRLLVGSKHLLQRDKRDKADSISRDHFLQATKSIWKPHPSMIPPEFRPAIDQVPRIECYYSFMQLYSFASDNLFLLGPPSVHPTISTFRQMRPNLISLIWDPSFPPV